jgi:hypothetical protein
MPLLLAVAVHHFLPDISSRKKSADFSALFLRLPVDTDAERCDPSEFGRRATAQQRSGWV